MANRRDSPTPPADGTGAGEGVSATTEKAFDARGRTAFTGSSVGGAEAKGGVAEGGVVRGGTVDASASMFLEASSNGNRSNFPKHLQLPAHRNGSRSGAPKPGPYVGSRFQDVNDLDQRETRRRTALVFSEAFEAVALKVERTPRKRPGGAGTQRRPQQWTR